MADSPQIKSVIDSTGKLHVYNVLGLNGHWLTYTQTDEITTDAAADGIVYRKYNGAYIKLDIEYLTPKMFNAKGDGVTDDNISLQNMINVAQATSIPINLVRPKSFYRSSIGLVISKTITMRGRDTSETGSLTTRIVFDQNTETYGINITTASASAGSILEGFTIAESSGPQSAYMFEYSPISGNILYQKGVSADFVVGNTYQVRSALTKTFVAVNGEFVANSLPVLCQRFLNYYGATGSFQAGQTLTGATSGATMVILYVGSLHPAVCANTVTGTFVAGEVVSTSTGSAFYSSLTVNTGVRVIDVTSVTGDLNKADPTGRLVSIINRKDYWRSGVLMQRRTELKNLKIQNFSGNGISIPGDLSNINCFKIERVGCTGNGGNGITIDGTDSNAGLTFGCTCVNNNGVAINDISFLGNAHYSNHSAGNSSGAYSASSYDARNSVFVDCYSEGSPSRIPFQQLESVIAGGAMFLNGVQGVPVINSTSSIDTGQEFSNNTLTNKRIMTYSGDRDTKLIATGFSLAGSPLAVSNGGNKGDNRGVGFDLLGPWGNQCSYEYASIFGNYAANLHLLQLKVRNASPLGYSIKNADGTATSGSGAMLLPTAVNGIITNVEIVAPGSGYAVNSILTISGSTGTQAVIYPIIRLGKVKGIKIVDGGTGYPDSSLQPIVEVGPTFFRPVKDAVTDLGTSTLKYSNGYIQTLRTGAGSHRITSGTGIPEAVVTATTGSKYYQTDGAAGLKGWIKDTGTTATGWKRVQSVNSGTTALRPVLTNNAYDIGVMYTDTTLQKPVWWWGTAWKDATGATV